jgi:hypothetical protein
MIPETQIITIYCDIDNFCKELDGYVENGLIEDKNKTARRGPKSGFCCLKYCHP